MAKIPDKTPARATPSKGPDGTRQLDRWGFFAGVKLLLSAFPEATTGEKAVVVAMALGAVMFIGLGLVGSVALPAWAVVSMFSLAILLIFGIAGMLVLIQRKTAPPLRCRGVPIYPPDAPFRAVIKREIEGIRRDALEQLQTELPAIEDADIRANIFLLALIQGGQADGMWKLVIHDNFAVNMRHPPELQMQLSIGQGATGVAFRDGTYQLTRRQPSKSGRWDRSLQMTPELEAQVHPQLKWIITFPLLKPDTSEAVGVLNIDGLADVADDNLLDAVAYHVKDKVQLIAKSFSLLPSVCIGIDQLGVLPHV